jgi:hypothetical protein
MSDIENPRSTEMGFVWDACSPLRRPGDDRDGRSDDRAEEHGPHEDEQDERCREQETGRGPSSPTTCVKAVHGRLEGEREEQREQEVDHDLVERAQQEQGHPDPDGDEDRPEDRRLHPRRPPPIGPVRGGGRAAPAFANLGLDL